MDLMQCPICGKMFDPNESRIDDNGNPICSECYKKEQEEKE